MVEDARPRFIVRAALPRADVLADWRRSTYQHGALLFIVCAAFLILARFLVGALRQRKAAEERIAWLARTDGLTGLANRTTFLERLRQAFAAARRGGVSFAILCIDLDRFKEINDTLGHPAGDELLREVAGRLRQATREEDVIARLGGDEFAILQTATQDPADAGTLAAKLRTSLALPYSLGGGQVSSVSASIGISRYTVNAAGPDAMMVQADLALYRSKEKGRNQFHFHTDDLDQEMLERTTLTEELRHALEREELELFYQPQVEVISGKIVGMEALLRWNHPRQGLLSAARFIPVAEKVGLIGAIGHWVLDGACRQMSLWRAAGIAPPLIATNLSRLQLENGADLLRHVTTITGQHGIPPSCLEFDVTEATLAHSTLTKNDTLTRLRGLGAHIAIDDFGTEYSSFQYLRTYAVSHLKIGQSFINRANADADRAAMIRAVIGIAREIGIGVIAEGVETEAQRALLATTGSMTHAQGHYFSEAVGADRAGELLRQGTMKPLAQLDEAALADTVLLTGTT
jgi:diguanylate cyclase (GGDEF)-like protein